MSPLAVVHCRGIPICALHICDCQQRYAGGIQSCHPKVKCNTMKGSQHWSQMCTSALFMIDVRLCESHAGDHMSYLLVRKIVMAYSTWSWALHRGHDPIVKLTLVFNGLCVSSIAVLELHLCCNFWQKHCLVLLETSPEGCSLCVSMLSSMLRKSQLPLGLQGCCYFNHIQAYF